MKNSWDEVYKDSSIKNLGWYEENSEPSLGLIEKYVTDKNSLILDVGCGETTLIQSLIDKDYTNISGIDLSSVAINFLKNNTKTNKTTPVNLSLEVGDLTHNINFSSKGNLWHDRAVFHFLHSDCDRKAYKNNLINFLEKDGFFIISCFSKDNSAEKCNGLLVKKYDTEELVSFFGDSFVLLENFSYEYIMPWGDKRYFLYCVFIKK